MITINFFNSATKVPETAWQLMSEPSVEGRWWYESLERSDLQEQFKFWYAVVLDSDQPVVLVPLFFMQLPISVILPDWIEKQMDQLTKIIPWGTTFRTLFVGSPFAEEGALGVAKDADLPTLIIHLNKAMAKFARVNRSDLIVWKDFRDYRESLLKLVEKENFFAMTSFPGSVIQIEIEAATLEDYLRTLDSQRRKRIKKKLAKSHARGELVVEQIQQPDDKLLSQIFDLFEQTYARGKTKFERLSITFFQEVAKSAHAWFIVLRNAQTLEPVAFNLCFLSEQTVVQKFIGLDYKLGQDWYLYFRLWEESMNWALSHGAKSIQSGQTSYSAKLELGYELTPLSNFCHHLNPLVNNIGKQLAKNINWSTLDEDLAVYLKAHPELLTRSQA